MFRMHQRLLHPGEELVWVYATDSQAFEFLAMLWLRCEAAGLIFVRHEYFFCGLKPNMAFFSFLPLHFLEASRLRIAVDFVSE